MGTSIIVGIIGGAILVGFVGYNVYDNFFKKEDTSNTASTKK